MSNESQRATLLCSQCGKTTDHRFVYAGRLLTHIECENCGYVVHPENQADLSHEYVLDLKQRLRTKPRRLARRAFHHPLTFLAALPKAILRQPVKLIQEFRTVRKEERDNTGR
jgi:DNA-directed RNA polymerase subunit RPC12/RpoP